MRSRALGLALAALVAVTTVLPAQGYRVRMDLRAQGVSYRGATLDSVLLADVVTGPTGGPVSPDGFAVRCLAGPHCYFYRPGSTVRAIPVSAGANLVVWGLGVRGMSLHATARAVGQAGDEDSWPTLDPAVQLLEGFLEYHRSDLLARAGRLLVSSRLEPVGMDGGWARLRWDRTSLELTGYGGWGLGQAAVVPITSPALNPLDEWRPRDRQLIGGVELAWLPGPADLRAEYRREVDQETNEDVSERAAFSAVAQVTGSIRANGGFDWNVAEGHIGSADLSLTWVGSRVQLAAGGKRYRPYFSLWTLWGAFSPVPYHAVHGSAQVRAVDWVTVRVRGERFWFLDHEATTPLTTVETRGWRTSAGLSLTPAGRFQADLSGLAEFGPGASSRSFDATVRYRATEDLSVAVYGGALERPLEFRFADATGRWFGGRADWQVGNRWRVWGDAAWVDQDRQRDDAAAWEMDQVRLRAGLTLTFGSEADRAPLPPARRRQP